MRTPFKILLPFAAATLAAAPGAARAQFDVDPPLPNVLLLIDSSGSMEYLPALDASGKGQLPGSVPGSACVAGTTPTVLNRWATLVSVLTGQINNFSCQATPRSGAFITEYTTQGVPPYDHDYFLPFHRLLSNGCTAGPGALPAQWWDWPNDAIRYHDVSSVSIACSGAGFSQATDGVLDTFRDRVRFGMMTFDTFGDPSVGTSGDAPDIGSGVKGLWSYFPSWPLGSGAFKTGNLPNAAPIPFEVGARNQAAPPWEGRLIGFGPSDAALSDVQKTNDHIQEALIAMRPYGASPIAGMLEDAREFLQNDATTDPATGKPFGPSQDPLVKEGCRKTSIILLSDGEPNMDLLPQCAQAGGNCPYPPPDVIAEELASLPGSSQIQTYVIGFGVSDPSALASVGKRSCAELDPAQDCASPPAGLKACCALSRIAEAGGTGRAFFADDQLGLKAHLSSILAGIASASTARTVPVFSSIASAVSSTQGKASAAGYRFIARFNADSSGRLWTGQLDRERFVCTSQNGKLTASLEPPDPSLGDDFAADINESSPSRRFFTFAAPALSNGQVLADRTIRPGIDADDGLGLYGKGALSMPLLDGSTFATTLAATPQLLGMSPSSPPPPSCSTTLKASTASACANLLVRWEVGENNPTLPDTRDAASCAVAGTCSELGSIYHSTPAVVGPPQDLIRDDSYVKFAVEASKRPLMLYTASTDGQLHAFKVAASDPADTFKVDTRANNELWSFLPPRVLPNLLSSYNQQALLTDGAPVTADVVYERRRSQPAKWNTVLVAGGGTAGGFYYALDITDPRAPRFLWQLSTDDKGSSLFGRTTPRPAIATVTIPDGQDVKEVAVAILAGGTSSPQNGACSRDNTGSLIKSAKYPPRTKVHCWAQPGAARSLTIVRLDTGEVLMSFRGAATDRPAGLTTNAKVVNFSAPISGVPAPYPAQLGQVADRIYVGDADGALWRIDLSGGDPQKWTASLAWDAYSLEGDNFKTGEPVQTAPVISTNAIGDTVILYATGDQDLLQPNAAMQTRLWSLVEKRNAAQGSFEFTELFVKPFTGGERVTGPMALFASTLYFSTFTPAAAGGACAAGGSRVWGIDYQSAAPAFPDDKKPGSFKLFEEAPSTIIFGVTVTQTPICADTECAPDPFFGQTCAVTGVDGGQYEIVWQKGSGPGVTNNTLVTTTPDGVQSLRLQSPPLSTRIDSWASILE